jgi:hypothetical protein
MRKLIAIAVLSTASALVSPLAAETYPRSGELVAAQDELDAMRGTGPRDQMNAEARERLDAAISRREAELDKRNAEWKERDSVSMLKAQAETCGNVRQGVSEGKKATSYFDELRYVGFSSDETLDVILQIDRQTPKVGKSVRVAFCILGLPSDTLRTETKDSRRVRFVYPKILVHAEDGVVTAWSDR